MAEKSLEERVSALEAQLGGKTLEEHFREQSYLIDRLFIYRFEENDKKWDARFEEKLETKLEAKLEEKLRPIRTDLAAVKDAVKIILTRLR